MKKDNKYQQVAAPNRGVKRVLGKIMQLLARKLPLIPGKMRVYLQVLHGVQFKDASSTFLGEDVLFDDIYPELITVGKNVRITAGTRILAHFFDTRFVPTPDRPFRFYTGKVVIGDNVFIGMNTVIAKPVTIGEGAVIGANSVVTKDIPKNAIAVGSPAKVVGKRPAMQLEATDVQDAS